MDLFLISCGIFRSVDILGVFSSMLITVSTIPFYGYSSVVMEGFFDNSFLVDFSTIREDFLLSY